MAGLNPGEIYSYDLLITPDGGSPAAPRRPRAARRSPRAAGAWLALGYQQDWLPSFATVPNDVADLRFVQGSCRGSTEPGRDAFPPVDDLIRSALTDPTQRPHLMFLTGDQIYADEIGRRAARPAADPSAAISWPVRSTITVDFPKIKAWSRRGRRARGDGRSIR